MERATLVRLAMEAVAKRSARGHGGSGAKGHVPAMALHQTLSTKYDLLANLVHDSPPVKGKQTAQKQNPLSAGTYRAHVRNPVRAGG